MRVLVGCEFSGRVRNAFRARGHDAFSCDVMPSRGSQEHHIRADVRTILRDGWDMAVFFPPCKYLTTAGAGHWGTRQHDINQELAIDFVLTLMNAPISRVAIENPVGRIGTAIRPADQIIQPYWFGDPWRKATCLWLQNLPPLTQTNRVKPIGPWAGGTENRRTGKRSVTFHGVAVAMADQWGRENGPANETCARHD